MKLNIPPQSNSSTPPVVLPFASLIVGPLMAASFSLSVPVRPRRVMQLSTTEVVPALIAPAMASKSDFAFVSVESLTVCGAAAVAALAPVCEAFIASTCNDPANREDGEAPPPPKAISAAEAIIRDARIIRGSKGIPMGEIAPYFGEVGVTWRNSDRSRVLRLTSFPDGRLRLDHGTTPRGALGVYEFDENATADILATRLNELENVVSAGQ